MKKVLSLTQADIQNLADRIANPEWWHSVSPDFQDAMVPELVKEYDIPVHLGFIVTWADTEGNPQIVGSRYRDLSLVEGENGFTRWREPFSSPFRIERGRFHVSLSV